MMSGLGAKTFLASFGVGVNNLESESPDAGKDVSG
jgi:hypothetical protein